MSERALPSPPPNDRPCNVEGDTVTNVHFITMKMTGKNGEDAGGLHDARSFRRRFFLPSSVILVLIEVR